MIAIPNAVPQSDDLRSPDRFHAWPLCVAFVVPVTFATLASFSEILALLLLPGASLWFLAVCSISFFAARSLWIKRWRQAISLAVVPGSIVLAGLMPFTISQELLLAGDYMHLLIGSPMYLAEIAGDVSPHGDGFRYMQFNWGVRGLSPTADRSLIYDETGTAATRGGRHSIFRTSGENACSEVRRQEPSEAAVDCIAVRHLLGHFYLVDYWTGFP
jgi:hypothetical protein